jgi:hypothetical protein
MGDLLFNVCGSKAGVLQKNETRASGKNAPVAPIPLKYRNPPLRFAKHRDERFS